MKDSRPSEGFNNHILQRTSPKDKCLVGKQNHFVRGPEEIVGPKEGKQSSGISSSSHLKKCQMRTRKSQRAIRRERQNPSGKSLIHRNTEFQRKGRQQWTMCSIWI
ncbi:hypothetical protein O181_055097 [Austropuccinia psidii MF-1]|uniref:Uncharacterized protein n=1 Tax=Austropuccinia psidii MF-1 TaxID=1389203 RepID=A0A9Q3HT50_9BASI|nr:hypothetical protein [Austropuccinia psidii MF-1]